MYNEIAQNNNPANEPKKLPLFEELLDQVRYEAETSATLSDRIMGYCNVLNPMVLPQEKEPIRDKVDSNFVSRLSLQISIFRNSNAVLRECVNHLNNLVGDK